MSRSRSRSLSRPAAALALCLLVPMMLGCIGFSLGLGPLGLHVGAGGAPERKPPTPPPLPHVKKETIVVEEPDGSLRQEGEVSVPPRKCLQVYYLRPFAATPHLEVREPDEDAVNFVITEQAVDHFTLENQSLLCTRTFVWRARTAPISPSVTVLPDRPVPVK